LVFTTSALNFRNGSQDAGAVPYPEISAFEIGGPGARRSGGGFAGGGFGVAGAAEGMLIAAALNMMTTHTKIDTVICLQTSDAELFLHNGNEPPDALRMRLSPIFNILRKQASSSHAPPAELNAPAAHGAVVDRLTQLGQLLDRGLITEDEFKQLKAELLGPTSGA
jgi:hypothetical protein